MTNSNSIGNSNKGTRNGFLDLIKFVATVLILFHHFQQGFSFRLGLINFWGGSFYFGRLVELFFMISGFLMISNIPKITKELSFKKFMTKRYVRLIPMVAIGTIADFFLKLFIVRAMFMESPLKYVLETVTVAMGVHGIFSNKVTFANNPMWYVSSLVFCYLIFYLCFWACNKLQKSLRSIYLLLPVVIILVGEAILIFAYSYPLANEYIGRGYVSFFGGILVGLIIKKIQVSDRVLIPFSVTVFILAVISLYFVPALSYDSVAAIYTVFVLYSQIIVISQTKAVSRLFNNSVISTLAKISFHAYCLHIPVKSVFEILTKQDSFKVFLYAYPWLCMIIFVVTVYAVSYFSYRFIEKPLAGFFSKKGI